MTRKFDAVVGNPPWDRAIKISRATSPSAGYVYLEFVARTLAVTAPGGTISLVLPTSWLTLKKMSSFRSWLKSRALVTDIVILENLTTNRWFPGIGTDCCVLTLQNTTPTGAHSVTYSYEFGTPWTVDLDHPALSGTWPMYTSASDYNTHLHQRANPRFKSVRCVNPTDMDLQSGRGYVSGTVVGYNKNRMNRLVDGWVVNQRLPILSEHSLNNQWTLEFDTPADARDYLQYARGTEFQTILRTMVPSYKLQPYLLEYVGYVG